MVSIGRWHLMRVRGRSMQPTLQDGDVLVCRRRHAEESVEPGRLVIVQLPGNRPLAIKRLTERTGRGWWVERDNPNEGVDSWLVGAIPDDALLAVVVARITPHPRRLGAETAPTP